MYQAPILLTLASYVAAQGTYNLPYGSLPVKPCPQGVQIIAVSGQGSKNVGGFGLIASLVTDIMDKIPNSDNVTLPYNKGESDNIDKINVGTQNLLTYIPDFNNQCPYTPIVLAGYSSGGIITMGKLVIPSKSCAGFPRHVYCVFRHPGPFQAPVSWLSRATLLTSHNVDTLCGGTAPWAATSPLDSSYSDSILATILYGEETRVANQSYNEGTCTKSAPRTPRMNPSACAPFAPNIQSYCDTQDPQCCSGGTDQQQ